MQPSEPPRKLSSAASRGRRRRERGAVTALVRIARAVDRAMREGATMRHGMTPAQLETLRFAAVTRPDVANVGQLSRVLGVRHETAVGIMAPLLDEGLIERRTHPFDGRMTIVGITRKGRRALRTAEATVDDLDRTVAALDDPELEALESALASLIERLRSRGVLVISAPCAGCVHFRPNEAPGSAEPHRCALLGRFLSDAATRMECPEHQPAA